MKLLETEGLVSKVVVPVQGGKYRTLTPNPAAIAAKAATNPYPEVPVNTRRNFRHVENGSSHTPEIPAVIFQLILQVISIYQTGRLAKLEVVAQAEQPNAQASHTEGGAAAVGTAITKRRLLLRDSPLATLATFVACWQAAAEAHPATYAPYAQADLAHYHGALLGWSNAEGKTKFDWLSTILGSMRRDADKNLLRLAGGAHSLPAFPHALPDRSYPVRSPNGAKPSGDAGKLARALFAHTRRQSDSTGPGPGQ